MKCCMTEKLSDPKKKALDDKITAIGWALFFVMIGGLLLMPKGIVPDSAWLIGAGLIMIGANIARRKNGIRLCGCGTGLGAVLLLAGIFGLFGIVFPIIPVLLVLVGVGIIMGIVKKKSCK